LVFYWSYKNDLLIKNISNLVKKVDTSLLNHEVLLYIMDITIGKELIYNIYNEDSKEFVVDYVAFTSQWHYQYHKDIEEIYPKIKSFAEIPQSEEEYEKIFTLLDKRFAEYYNIEELVQEEEQEKEPLPLIHLSSNQTVPKTGRYQATLPKGHDKEELIAHSGFDIKHLKEGESVGTFGLSGSDEYDIVWVYLGE